MKHTQYTFLVFLISLINCTLVRSTSSLHNTENVIESNSISKNVTTPDNEIISDELGSTTIQESITPIPNITESEDTKSTEYDNAVDPFDSKGFRNRSGNVIPSFPTTPKIHGIDDNENFRRGYFGGYYYFGTDDSHYFSHGKYQKPTLNYYGNYNHTLEDKSTLGYYLGYGMNKMDHNEYFQHNNFTHYNIHHYFYMNSTMLPEQDVGSDHLIFCAQNTSTFCPESTEPICLLNTTVWCATKMLFVKRCEENGTQDCVTTRIPCVKSDDVNCNHLLEVLKLPCISRIRILDVYEDKNGLTFNNVAGTFVLSPVPPVSERTYCITIVAEPTRNHTN